MGFKRGGLDHGRFFFGEERFRQPRDRAWALPPLSAVCPGLSGFGGIEVVPNEPFEDGGELLVADDDMPFAIAETINRGLRTFGHDGLTVRAPIST